MIHEPRFAGEYILREIPDFARDEKIISGGHYPAATVLGQLKASGHLVQLNPTASDGSEKAAAILYDMTDASATDKIAVVTARLTVINGHKLHWPDNITEKQQQAAIAQLAERHIVVR
ncbi:head decoration protein [Spartinivicinus ruber]|uniref:head decoration protein n=1 Tax=Spartinivicinus ruber TaxID=2683272 RepID=UPI0013D081C8|nr:head decoration protein [Spartinivicinus ruber]